MIDTSAIAVWAWDARPFPDFPARTDIWSDGANWQTGHWINGRTGLVPLADVIADLCTQAGLDAADVSGVSGLVSGVTVDRPMRARDALASLMLVYDVTLTEVAGVVRFFTPSDGPIVTLEEGDFVQREQGLVAIATEDGTASLRDARLSFIDATRDYQAATVSARNALAETVRIADVAAPLVLDSGQARRIAERMLLQSEPARQRASFTLSPSAAERIELGGRVRFPDIEGIWQVTRLQSAIGVAVEAVRLTERQSEAILSGPTPGPRPDTDWISEPVSIAFDLPGQDGVQVGAVMDPFRATTLSLQDRSVTLDAPLRLGALLSDLPCGPVGVWDRGSGFDIWMPGVQLASRPAGDILSGGNRFAVETPKGWEVIGAADIVLTGPDTYRLSTLLRGLSQSDDAQVERLPAGARVIALDRGVGSLPLDPDFIGQAVEISVAAAGRSGVAASLDYRGADLRPLSPVHLRALPDADGVRLSWIPRNLDDADAVRTDATYRVTWPSGTRDVSAVETVLPIVPGQQTPVEIAEIGPLTGPGDPAKIIV